jgi:hypothetical protein
LRAINACHSDVGVSGEVAGFLELLLQRVPVEGVEGEAKQAHIS